MFRGCYVGNVAAVQPPSFLDLQSLPKTLVCQEFYLRSLDRNITLFSVSANAVKGSGLPHFDC